jgi:prephenate dehydrogenase
MRVALLGLGLIGGSIARALREDPAGAGPFGGESLEIAAWTPSQIGPRTALAAGSIDFVGRSIAEAVDGAAIVILSAPPIAMAELLDELVVCRRSGRLTDAAVVTDVGSTKRWIMAEASKRGLRFVGGHPMAGSHETGFSAADPNLFLGRPWVVVPGDRSGAGQALVEQLATACGARPVTMDAELHDTATAGISHLPLLLAAALTGSVALDEFKREHTLEYQRLVDSGELEQYLVDAPSPQFTQGARILGIVLILCGLTLLALVVTGFLGDAFSGH